MPAIGEGRSEKIRKIIDRFSKSAARMEASLNAANKLAPGTELAVVHDMVRANLVLLHSSFEDSLRSLQIELVPLDSGALRKIPLTLPNGDSEKIKIAELLEYKNLSIDDLIRACIRNYFDHWTLSKVEHLFGFLERLSIDVAPFRKYVFALEFLIQRRHRIVHHADHRPDGELAPFDDRDMSLLIVAGFATQLFLTDFLASISGVTPEFQEMAQREARDEALKGLGMLRLEIPGDQFPNC